LALTDVLASASPSLAGMDDDEKPFIVFVSLQLCGVRMKVQSEKLTHK
jgi:hypothetical protein